MIPSLREWHNTYQDQGLVFIGNHYPEFSHERDLNNLKQTVRELKIDYAVAQDNQGNIRTTHIGEGAYNETEAVIQTLLAEPYPQE